MQHVQHVYQQQNVRKPESQYRKPVIFIIVLIIIGTAVAFIWRGCVREGEWVCDNGEWIAKGKVHTPKPDHACVNSDGQDVPKERVKPAAEFIEIDSKRPVEGIDIRVTNPHVNSTITSPVTVSGEAKDWFVDGKILVQILDEKGNVLAQNDVAAKGEGEEFTKFETTIEFDRKGAKAGDLVFQKINPSNDPAQARTFSFPVFFE